MLGAVFSKLRFTKPENNFWIISECVLQRKKWGLFSENSLQELQIIPESENLEVIGGVSCCVCVTKVYNNMLTLSLLCTQFFHKY